MCLLPSPLRPQLSPGQQASGPEVTSGSHASNTCLQISEVKGGVVAASVVGWVEGASVDIWVVAASVVGWVVGASVDIWVVVASVVGWVVGASVDI